MCFDLIGIPNLTLVHKIYIAMAIRISQIKRAGLVALKKIFNAPGSWTTV
jgi:hypothetical protein